MKLNPYSSSKASSAITSEPGHPAVAHWLLDALTSTWIAFSLSTFFLCLTISLYVDGALASLVHSDDSYVASLGISACAAGFFCFGTFLGNWLHSRPIRWGATYAPLLGFSTVLGIWDFTENLGEGDQLVGHFAVALAISAISGCPALAVRHRGARIALALVPASVVAIGYTVAAAQIVSGTI